MSSNMTAPVVEMHHGIKAALGDERAEQLKARFICYQLNCRPPDFGRDQSLDFPDCAYKAGLMHIHILPQDKIDEYRRRGEKRQFKQTSDIWLIYVRHMYQRNRFLLIAYVPEPAHETSRLRKLLIPDCASIAEEFHSR